MKTRLTVMSLAVLSLTFQGCPYESAVPIDEASVKINPSLLGTWYSDNGDQDKRYEVAMKDDYHYRITEFNGTDQNDYEAFTSDIAGTMFLNLQALQQDTDRTYVFYKVIVSSAGEITLSEITENIDEEFSSSAELKKFIKSNMKNSYFFGRDEIHLKRK